MIDENLRASEIALQDLLCLKLLLIRLLPSMLLELPLLRRGTHEQIRFLLA